MDKNLPNVIAYHHTSGNQAESPGPSRVSSMFALGTIAQRLVKLASSNVSLSDQSPRNYFSPRPRKPSFDDVESNSS